MLHLILRQLSEVQLNPIENVQWSLSVASHTNKTSKILDSSLKFQ